MREGVNPGKVTYQLPPFGRHRVVLPIFVPEESGYYRHSVEIVRLCLDSLIKTSAGRTSITVISNGSIAAVDDLLYSLYESQQIQQLVINTHNWGKIDAVLAAVHGRFEPLITVADADVLFLPGWLEAVEELFFTFPEVGFVTPSPNPSLAFAHTTATIFAAALRRELHHEKVVPDLDLDMFAESIGRPTYFAPQHHESQLIVRRDGVTACVGGGHFVFTLRSDVIDRLGHEPAMAALGEGMTSRFDDPPDAMGAWRLSTTRAFARHMGNVPEPWMYQALADMPTPSLGTIRDEPLPAMRFTRLGRVPLRWRKRALSGLRRYGFTPGRGSAPVSGRHERKG